MIVKQNRPARFKLKTFDSLDQWHDHYTVPIESTLDRLLLFCYVCGRVNT